MKLAKRSVTGGAVSNVWTNRATSYNFIL